MSEAEDAFNRGEVALKNAEKFLEIDLPTAANRVYIAGENFAAAALMTISGSYSRDHGKIWNALQRLYEKGALKSDYRPILETSYRLRVKGDYGRDVDGAITLSKEALKEQIDRLKGFSKEIKGILRK